MEAENIKRNDSVSITFEVTPAKRDALLKMVTDNNDINIKR